MGRVLPILFNTDMVRAILDGRKTVTRRIMKTQPDWFDCGIDGKRNTPMRAVDIGDTDWEIKQPFHVDDILYVREAYCANYFDYITVYDNKHGYRADFEEVRGEIPEPKWKPSIHMPKEAARIFLKVTDVRVERLRDITTDQAISEGFDGIPCNCGGCVHACTDCYNTGWQEPPEVGFMYTWDSTCKKSLQVNGWDANPWVWVIEFERCEKPDKQHI